MKYLSRMVAGAALTIAASLAGARSASAQDYCSTGFVPDVFYNYYVAPVACGAHGAMGAQLYVCPLPVPPRVGNTYITYQPLAPQEFLYPHKRCYYRTNGPYGSYTKTHVCWW